MDQAARTKRIRVLLSGIGAVAAGICGFGLPGATMCRAQVTTLRHSAAQWGKGQSEVEWARLRNYMVDKDIADYGVKSSNALAAMRNTPRHEFVASKYRKLAYFDMALPIGDSQTISPPLMVAKMTEL